MDPNVVAQLLLQAGFDEHSPTMLDHHGRGYSRPSLDGWTLSAYASKQNGLVTHVDLSISPRNDSAKGTQHRVTSERALRTELEGIIRVLEQMASAPDRLKCPKCKIRWVHMKEGQHFRPFLSCDGMVMAGKSGERHPKCDGISDELEALLVYD